MNNEDTKLCCVDMMEKLFLEGISKFGVIFFPNLNDCQLLMNMSVMISLAFTKLYYPSQHPKLQIQKKHH